LSNPYSVIQESRPDTNVCDIRDNVIEFPIRSKRKMI